MKKIYCVVYYQIPKSNTCTTIYLLIQMCRVKMQHRGNDKHGGSGMLCLHTLQRGHGCTPKINGPRGILRNPTAN